jgi:hypothetical protein
MRPTFLLYKYCRYGTVHTVPNDSCQFCSLNHLNTIPYSCYSITKFSYRAIQHFSHSTILSPVTLFLISLTLDDTNDLYWVYSLSILFFSTKFPLENPPLVLCGDTMVLFDDFYTYTNHIGLFAQSS